MADTDPGIAEATRWLIEQQTLVRAPKREPLPTPIASGGSMMTVAVAAATSTEFSKGKADFVCTGANDEGTIQRALNICAGKGGTVWLAEGGYYIEVPTTGPAIIIPPTVTLRGLGGGDGGSFLEQTNVSDPGRQALVRMRTSTNLYDLTFYAFDSALPIQFETNAQALRVADCWIETDQSAAIEGNGNDRVWIERNHFTSQDNPVIEDDSMIHLAGGVILDIWIRNNWINSGWHGIFIDGQQGRIFIDHNIIYQSWYSGIRLKSDSDPIFATSIDHNSILTPGVGSDGSAPDGGIYVTADAADIDPLTVQNNMLSIDHNRIEVAGAVIYGIGLNGIAIAQVHANQIEQAGIHGIHLEDSNGNQIFDNLLQEPNTFPTNTFDGIHLVTSDRNHLSRNTVIERGGGSPNRWRYGINVSDAASNLNIVAANDLRLATNGTGAFNDAGTGTVATPANYV